MNFFFPRRSHPEPVFMRVISFAQEGNNELFFNFLGPVTQNCCMRAISLPRKKGIWWVFFLTTGQSGRFYDGDFFAGRKEVVFKLLLLFLDSFFIPSLPQRLQEADFFVGRR